jgi:hypothetical protein
MDMGSMEVYYKASDDKIYFTDGTNTISTAAQTFSAGDLIVLHIVFGPSSMKIYKNGVEAATGSSYVGFYNSDIYIGSNATPANHGCMTFLDITTWSEIASAAEILADYTDLYQVISGGDGYGQRLHSLPWYWTEDGGVIDSYCDSSHLDTAVIGGIDGDAPAETVLHLVGSGAGNLLMGLLTSEDPLYVRDHFADQSGTVVASTLGGEVDVTSVDTSDTQGPGDLIIKSNRKPLYGKQVYALVSLSDAGSNLLAQLDLRFSSGSFTILSDWQPLAADTTLRKFLIGPVVIPDGHDQEFYPYPPTKSGPTSTISFVLRFKRSSGSAANVSVDFYRILTDKIAYCEFTETNSISHIVRGNMVVSFDAFKLLMYEQGVITGQQIEFEPNKYNYLTVLTGNLDGAMAYTANYTTIDSNGFITSVTPRWKLL